MVRLKNKDGLRKAEQLELVVRGQINKGVPLAAFIPTPIYFGMLMDRSCLVRTLPLGHICTEEHANMASSAASKALKLPALVTVEGACLEYDVYSLPYAWLGGVTVAKCLSIVIATLTWRYAV